MPRKKAASLCNLPSNQRAPLTPSAGLLSTCGFVTDRCNLRCRYCMPEEEHGWLPREKLLSFEEISELAGIFTEVGIEKVRLTGGEPLLRKDLPVLARMLAQNPRIRDLALTTNGVLLPTLSSANSAVSRLIKNNSSNHDARYNDFAG